MTLRFISAAQQGDLALMQQLRNEGAVVTGQDANGWSAFHEAARAGHTAVIEFLISADLAGVAALTKANGTARGCFATLCHRCVYIRMWWPSCAPIVRVAHRRGTVDTL